MESEAPRTIQRPEMRPKPGHSLKGGMLLSDFLAGFEATGKTVEQTYAHRLGPGVTPEALANWESRHSEYPLPKSLKELLLRINGIHLWANSETQRAHQGLAPLEEWGPAPKVFYGEGATDEFLDKDRLAISYHTDSHAYVVLNVVSGRYFLVDTAGPDGKSPIVDDVSELLGWLWEQRIPPEGA